ncbi:hypothetical protein V6U81_22920 [Micromonospora sp. CPCC 205711]|uniref:hypothetical protein n=1 Tax=Micromonospora sp. CPCC 205547 TaxID=3122400 RepID=UPI002FF1E859
MTTAWVVLAVFGLVLVGAFGWVAWRDRARIQSAEDHTAARAALKAQQRNEGARHVAQGNVIHRGQDPH